MKVITTLTGSKYYIDGNHVCRFPGTGTSILRRDGQDVTITARGGIMVGQPMVFLLEKLADKEGVRTVRVTTPVVEIAEIDSVDELIETLREGGSLLGQGAHN